MQIHWALQLSIYLTLHSSLHLFIHKSFQLIILWFPLSKTRLYVLIIYPPSTPPPMFRISKLGVRVYEYTVAVDRVYFLKFILKKMSRTLIVFEVLRSPSFYIKEQTSKWKSEIIIRLYLI